MELADKIECGDCHGTGKVLKSVRSIHDLPENVCANAMYSDSDLYNMTKEHVRCGTCKGEGYLLKK